MLCMRAMVAAGAAGCRGLVLAYPLARTRRPASPVSVALPSTYRARREERVVRSLSESALAAVVKAQREQEAEQREQDGPSSYWA